MRRIALINQKGGVGKTTTTVNLGAALAEAGKRVLVIDLDPQANLSVHLDCDPGDERPSIYDVLTGNCPLSAAIRPSGVENLRVVPSDIDLSGAELELAASFGRESLLKDALEQWVQGANGDPDADYLLFDCPPSLGLLSVNGMVAASEVILTLQTEFFALQGMSKLVEVIGLLRRRLNPELEISGILPCLYDTRLKLAREVLAEIRKYFPGQVFERPIGKNVKLAEAPSYGQTILQYAPDSSGAQDYRTLARAVIAQEQAPSAAAGSATGDAGAASPEPEAELTPAPAPPRPPQRAPRAPAPRLSPDPRVSPGPRGSRERAAP